MALQSWLHVTRSAFCPTNITPMNADRLVQLIGAEIER